MTKTTTVTLCLGVVLLLQVIHLSRSQPYIGINYGQIADNLPPPSTTAKLLQSTSIQKLRLYNSDPTTLKAFSNTKLSLTIGVANGDIPALSSPDTAKSYVTTNVLPFYPATNIILISVGNEVFLSGDPNLMSQLLPAMKNVQNALAEAGIGADKIRVSTVHAMAVLAQSDPPSAGSFDPSYGELMTGLLGFLNETGAPFAINPYPYFAYQSDPRPDTLAFCLFEGNAGRLDAGSGIKYMSMFDAQVDAIHSALDKAGFKGLEIMVAETGWPYKGDANEIGPSIENAKAYNGNLIKHLRSMVGTPLMPGKSIDTYLFALYDEDLKPGPSSERSFGLFKPDLSMTYDVGLDKTGPTAEGPANVGVAPAVSVASPTSVPAVAGPTVSPVAGRPVVAVDPGTVAKGFSAPPAGAVSHSASSGVGLVKRGGVSCGFVGVGFVYFVLMFL